MSKKLWTVLLLLTLMLGSTIIFWSKPALSNTESEISKVNYCTAEPWGDIEDTVPPDSTISPVKRDVIFSDGFSLGRRSGPDGVYPARDNRKVVSPPDWRFYLTWLYQLFFR